MTPEQLKRMHFEAQFNEAAKSLEDYYAIGNEAIRLGSGGGPYAPGVCSSIAEKYGVGMSMIARARRVAREYTKERLHEVIGKCHAQDFIPGREMLAILATIPKDQREAWENAIISGRWSVRDLRLEVKEAFGRRSNGKKWHKLPVNLKEAVHQVGGIYKHWRELSFQLKAALSRSIDDDGGYRAPFVLSRDLRVEINNVTNALGRMHEELKKQRQSREGSTAA